MPRIYFEPHEDDTCVSDLNASEVATARAEAARALVDIARGVLSGAIWQDTSIEIMDDVGRVILWADIYFSADRPEQRPALN